MDPVLLYLHYRYHRRIQSRANPLFNENARAVNPDNLPAQPISELVATVKDQFPTANVTTVMTFEPYIINAVVFSDENIPMGIAYVNQYTGEIQEVNQGITFINFMRSLHSWLLFPARRLQRWLLFSVSHVLCHDWRSGYRHGHFIKVLACLLAT